MKRARCWLFAALICAGVSQVCLAEDLVITSFDGRGQLVFNALNNGTSYVYRVEWAPSAAGPWTCFEGASGLLHNLPDVSSGSVTSVVPTCFRIVALPVAKRGMVRVPAGTNSGKDPDGSYSLTVSEFYMDSREVSRARWAEVASWAQANGYDITSGSARSTAVSHPVYDVTWYECVKWCNARSEREGLLPCYMLKGSVYREGVSAPDLDVNADGYRLPTETEWEYAARGGLKGRLLPWGNTITHSLANYYSRAGYSLDQSPTRGYHPDYREQQIPYTSPVATFAPNGYGLYDIAGNVTEWCWDASGAYRGIRGGSWADELHELRCRADRSMDPGYGDLNVGFRCVCR